MKKLLRNVISAGHHSTTSSGSKMNLNLRKGKIEVKNARNFVSIPQTAPSSQDKEHDLSQFGELCEVGDRRTGFEILSTKHYEKTATNQFYKTNYALCLISVDSPMEKWPSQVDFTLLNIDDIGYVNSTEESEYIEDYRQLEMIGRDDARVQELMTNCPSKKMVHLMLTPERFEGMSSMVQELLGYNLYVWPIKNIDVFYLKESDIPLIKDQLETFCNFIDPETSTYPYGVSFLHYKELRVLLENATFRKCPRKFYQAPIMPELEMTKRLNFWKFMFLLPFPLLCLIYMVWNGEKNFIVTTDKLVRQCNTKSQ